MSEEEKRAAGGLPKPVKFVHEKAGQIPIFHADGAWATVNNDGDIYLNFYAEHPPVPEHVIFKVKPDGYFTGETEEPEDKDPEHFIVIREFQAAFALDILAAKQVHALLENFLKLAGNNPKE